jgi:hypothetical protein
MNWSVSDIVANEEHEKRERAKDEQFLSRIEMEPMAETQPIFSCHSLSVHA